MNVLAAVARVLRSHAQNRIPETGFEVEVLKQATVLQARDIISIEPGAVQKSTGQELDLSNRKRLQARGEIGPAARSRLESDN